MKKLLTASILIVLFTIGYSQEERENNLQTIDLNQTTNTLNFSGLDKPLKNPERGYSIRAGVVDIKPEGYRNFTVRMYDDDGFNFFHEVYNDIDSKTFSLDNINGINYYKTINVRELPSYAPYYFKDPIVGNFHLEFYMQAHGHKNDFDYTLVGLSVEKTASTLSFLRKYAMMFHNDLGVGPTKVQVINKELIIGGHPDNDQFQDPGSSSIISEKQAINKYEIIRDSGSISYYADGVLLLSHLNVNESPLFLFFSNSFNGSQTKVKLYKALLNGEEIDHTDFSFNNGTTHNFILGLPKITIKVSTKGDNTENVIMNLKRNSSGEYEVVNSHNSLSFDSQNQSITFNPPNQWADHYTDLEGMTKNSGHNYESMTDYYQRFAEDSISLMGLESYVYFTDNQLEGSNLAYQNLSSLSEKISSLSKQNGIKLQLTLNSDFIFQNKSAIGTTGDDFDRFNLTDSREQGLYRVMDQINNAVYNDINHLVATAHLGWIYMPHDNARYRESNHWKNAFIAQGRYYAYDKTLGENKVRYNNFPINNYHGELRESVQKDDWFYHVLGGHNVTQSVNQTRFFDFRNSVFKRTIEAFPNQKIILRSVMPARAFDSEVFRSKAPYGYSDVAFGHRYGHETTIASADIEYIRWGPNDSQSLGQDFGASAQNTNVYSLRRYRNNLWNHGKLGAFEAVNNYNKKTGAWIDQTEKDTIIRFSPSEFFQMINGDAQEENAGLYAAFKLRLFNYTSFDITKNNLLDGRNPYESQDEAGTTVIQRWKNEALDESTASSFGLTYSDGYFSRGSRSVYDYIRDHLGYRLEAKNLEATKQGTSLNVSIEIQNKGFAAPQLKRKAYLVLLDSNGGLVTNNDQLVQLELLDQNDTPVDWRDWQSTLFSNVKTKDENGRIIDLETNTEGSENESADCNIQNSDNDMENCLAGGIPLGRYRTEWYKSPTVIPQVAREYYTHTLKASIGSIDQLADGTYKLALWLPDNNEDLKTSRDYAVKLANSDIKTGPRGENILGQFTVNGPIEPGPIPDDRFSIVAQGTGLNLYQYKFEEGELSDGVWEKIPGIGIDEVVGIPSGLAEFQLVDMKDDKNIVAVHLYNKAKHSYLWDGERWNALPVITDEKENGSISMAHDGSIFAVQGHSIYAFNEDEFEWVKINNIDPLRWPRNQNFHNIDAFSKDEIYGSDFFYNAIRRTDGQMHYMTVSTTVEQESARNYEIAVGKDRSLWSSEYTVWDPSKRKIYQYDRDNDLWIKRMDDIRSMEALTVNQIALVDYQKNAYFWDGVNERIPLSNVDSEGNILDFYAIAIGAVAEEPKCAPGVDVQLIGDVSVCERKVSKTTENKGVWNSAVRSTDPIGRNGFVEFRHATNTRGNIYVGFAKSMNDGNPKNIDYAIRIIKNRIFLYEKGRRKKRLQRVKTGDLIRMKRRGRRLVIYKNSKRIYSKPRLRGKRHYAVVALNHKNHWIEDFNFGNSTRALGFPESVAPVSDLKNDIVQVPEDQVLLYPNPAKNELQIRLNKSIRNISVEILSLTGMLVYQRQSLSVNNGFVSIYNLEHIPSGQYILVISRKGGNKISKLLIKE